MSRPEIKNISLYQKENQRHIFGHPVLLGRRWPSSRTLGGLRWTLKLRRTSVTEAYGKDVSSWRPRTHIQYGLLRCGIDGLSIDTGNTRALSRLSQEQETGQGGAR